MAVSDTDLERLPDTVALGERESDGEPVCDLANVGETVAEAVADGRTVAIWGRGG